MSTCLRWAILVGCALAALHAEPAHAQDQAAAAQGLFEEGRNLLTQKKYPEACAKLAESEKLDPAVGTLLNLGDCYEKMGKVATAWAVFKDATSMAHAARQASREKLAAERASSLETKIPRLSIHVSHATQGLEVTRDGVAVGAAEWSGSSPSAVPTDPGEHEVAATAPGKKRWSVKVTLAADGATTPVLVPELAVDDLAERAPMNPAPATTSIEAVNTHDRNVQRTLGVVIGAIGVVSLIVSAPFGAIAISTNSDAKKACPTNTTCTPNGAADSQTAVRDGIISTVLIGVGGAVVVAGATVFLTAPSVKSRTGTALRLSPRITAGGGGLVLTGGF